MGESSLAAARGSEAAEAAASRERVARIQLDVQVGMSRELETRLEQALSGWRTEKQKAKENSAKVTELKVAAIEAQRVIQGLKEENCKLEQRLKLYDNIPLPVDYRQYVFCFLIIDLG